MVVSHVDATRAGCAANNRMACCAQQRGATHGFEDMGERAQFAVSSFRLLSQCSCTYFVADDVESWLVLVVAVAHSSGKDARKHVVTSTQSPNNSITPLQRQTGVENRLIQRIVHWSRCEFFRMLFCADLNPLALGDIPSLVSTI
jgi:hypothetical protein